MMTHQSNAGFLRLALLGNGAFSALTGAACLLVPGSISSLLFAVDSALFRLAAPAVVMEVGVALLAFAAFVAWTATRRRIGRTWAKLITFLDVVWVLGSVAALILMPEMWTPTGFWLVVVVAVLVGVFAVEQAIGLALMVDGQNEVEARWHDGRLTLTATATTIATPERVWKVMSDHEAYADVADNLSKVEVLGSAGPDMRRRCTDTQGRSWTETCMLWEEGQAYAFQVDTAAPDYPYPIAALTGHWSLTAEGHRTRIRMRFDVTAKPGLMNRMVLRLMAAPFARVCDRLLQRWIAIMENRIETEARSRPVTDLKTAQAT